VFRVWKRIEGDAKEKKELKAGRTGEIRGVWMVGGVHIK